ncbi:MAG: hypothetical protein AABX11_00890 [Nanoarchaeota archaeon]
MINPGDFRFGLAAMPAEAMCREQEEKNRVSGGFSELDYLESVSRTKRMEGIVSGIIATGCAIAGVINEYQGIVSGNIRDYGEAAMAAVTGIFFGVVSYSNYRFIRDSNKH